MAPLLLQTQRMRVFTRHMEAVAAMVGKRKKTRTNIIISTKYLPILYRTLLATSSLRGAQPGSLNQGKKPQQIEVNPRHDTENLLVLLYGEI